MTVPQGKHVYVTFNDRCIYTYDEVDMSALQPTKHEEADTRLFLHVADAVYSGHKSVLIRTTYSNVVVIAVQVINFRYIPVHTIANNFGPSKSLALPAFHALTGCDTVSAFFGKGKKSAFSVWQTYPELTLPLQLLAGPCPTVEMVERHLPRLEMFAVRLYGLNEEQASSVDEARLYLIKHQGKSFDKMPPSSDAFYQHIL